MHPKKLTVRKDKRSLEVTFENDEIYEITAEMLRVLSPSAEVQGHSPDQRKIIRGKEKVEIMRIEPVGNYAVRIIFDDMHDTGIYSWVYLYKLGSEKSQLWNNYQKELAQGHITNGNKL